MSEEHKLEFHRHLKDCDKTHAAVLNLYVVKTNNKLQHHGGLHTTTAPYSATAVPRAGDEIYLVLLGGVTRYYKDNKLLTATYRCARRTEQNGESVFVDLVTHAGRSPMLGEDGLESEHGNDFLASIWVPEVAKPTALWEFISGPDWSHAPCDVRVAALEDTTVETRKRSHRTWYWNVRDRSESVYLPGYEIERVSTEPLTSVENSDDNS